MRMSATRVRAIFRKELRDYRRNRQIVTSMAVLPLIFSVYPSIQILALPASSAGVLLGKQPLVYMLALPAIVPAVVAAYSVAGERQQDTLEPVLTTPIRREELLLGKALAALLPSLAVSYGVFGIFAAAMALFAQPPVASALLRGPALLAQLLFTPLVAAFDLGRHRHLGPVQRPPGRHPAQRARQRPLDRRDHHHLDWRDPRDLRSRPRPRGRPAGRRRPGLADRVPHGRPRAADHGDQIVTCAGGQAG